MDFLLDLWICILFVDSGFHNGFTIAYDISVMSDPLGVATKYVIARLLCIIRASNRSRGYY